MPDSGAAVSADAARADALREFFRTNGDTRLPTKDTPLEIFLRNASPKGTSHLGPLAAEALRETRFAGRVQDVEGNPEKFKFLPIRNVEPKLTDEQCVAALEEHAAPYRARGEAVPWPSKGSRVGNRLDNARTGGGSYLEPKTVEWLRRNGFEDRVAKEPYKPGRYKTVPLRSRERVTGDEYVPGLGPGESSGAGVAQALGGYGGGYGAGVPQGSPSLEAVAPGFQPPQYSQWPGGYAKYDAAPVPGGPSPQILPSLSQDPYVQWLDQAGGEPGAGVPQGPPPLEAVTPEFQPPEHDQYGQRRGGSAEYDAAPVPGGPSPQILPSLSQDPYVQWLHRAGGEPGAGVPQSHPSSETVAPEFQPPQYSQRQGGYAEYSGPGPGGPSPQNPSFRQDPHVALGRGIPADFTPGADGHRVDHSWQEQTPGSHHARTQPPNAGRRRGGQAR